MCGRYNNHLADMHAWGRILQDWPGDAELSYNVAPTTNIPIATRDGVRTARWGLVPSWAKEFKTKYSTINARIETVQEKRVYSAPWRAGRTCIIPAAGYYEWREEGGIKQPYYIHKQGDVIAFAGLWEPWRDRVSCTILTEEAFGNTAALHSRMPVTLSLEGAEQWLEQGTRADPTGSGIDFALQYHPVTRAVNTPSAHGEQLIQPVAQ